MVITGQGSCLYISIPLQSTDIYHAVHEQYKLNTTTANNNNNSKPTTTMTTTTADIPIRLLRGQVAGEEETRRILIE